MANAPEVENGEKCTVGGETAPATVTLKNNGERKIAGTYNVENSGRRIFSPLSFAEMIISSYL